MDNELKQLIQKNVKFIDLRSEKEFRKGSIPNAVNIPILTSDEYESVGIEYKLYGKTAAIKLGHKLVSGDVKKERVKDWCTFINKNPKTRIFCHRGGMRSKIALEWINQTKTITSAISGGYKRFRSLCLGIVKLSNISCENWIIIGGYTGSGKTEFIKAYNSMIDLEGLANHRGSAFGKKSSSQPTAANFENSLAFHYLRNFSEWLLLEDESRLIGKNLLHELWYQKMQKSKLVILETKLKERVDNIYREYIYLPIKKGKSIDLLKLNMINSLSKIQKRLGGKRYKEINAMMEKSFNTNEKERHKNWIRKILVYYYDPLYKYKMEKRKEYISFKGNKKEVADYLKDIGVN